MTALREALAGYLQVRRRLGFAIPQDGRLLEGFVEFLEQAGAERITTELALRWRGCPPTQTRTAGASAWVRLAGSRATSRRSTPSARSPPPTCCPGIARGSRHTSTQTPTSRRCSQPRDSSGRRRAVRHQTLIGLLAVTRGEGMRPAEALALDRQDVDLRHGVLHVRAGKQNKQHEVPLHHSTISALRVMGWREALNELDTAYQDPYGRGS